MAMSATVLSSSRLVPNTSSTVCTETPAAVQLKLDLARNLIMAKQF
jgi:hypothetical protein